jgi:hypothetical protein
MYAIKLAVIKIPLANTMANAVRCSKGDVFSLMKNPSKIWNEADRNTVHG